jgi:hypothetical protein
MSVWTAKIVVLTTFLLRVPSGAVRAEGIIKNVNTIEDFRSTDYAALLNTAGKQVRLLRLFMRTSS